MTKVTRQVKRDITRGGMSVQELEKFLDDYGVNIVRNTVNSYTAVVAFVLADKSNLDRDMVVKLLGEINSLFDDMNNDALDITPADCRTILDEEYGILID